MVSGTNNKLKTVWICHFSNADIRSHLPLSNRKFINIIAKIRGRKPLEYFDFAPWVTNQINEFKNFNDVELHIISPMKGLKKYTCEFNLEGINYHFFKADLPLIHIDVPNALYFNRKPNFKLNRYFISKFIDSIKPTIVNLIGAENPYYSISVLDIKNIPVYVSAQTVYNNPLRDSYSDSLVPHIRDVEMSIFKKMRYFGCSGRMHHDLILKYQPQAILFKNLYSIEKPELLEHLPKKFDFVFFAGVAKKKGIEDLLEAFALVLKKKPKSTLNIIGRCSTTYKVLLDDKIKLLGLSENIVFDTFFPVHSDMYKRVTESRIAVLPVKLDVVPGSIIEAILLDIPVVTYKTSGTPYLNSEGESILISEIGDIDGLAKSMLFLLNNPEYALEISSRAKKFIEKTYDNTTNAKILLENYKAVINHYFYNTPIPENLIFNLNEFPIYQ